MNAQPQMVIPDPDGPIRVRSQSQRRFVIAVVDNDRKARVVKRSDSREKIVQEAFRHWQASGWVFDSASGEVVRKPFGSAS